MNGCMTIDAFGSVVTDRDSGGNRIRSKRKADHEYNSENDFPHGFLQYRFKNWVEKKTGMSSSSEVY
jgi:hypothetical protein